MSNANENLPLVPEMSKVNGRRNPALARRVAACLEALDAKLVCAESCTGGMVSACLASVPGISNSLCGSFVTYRPMSKRRWLKVSQQTIDECTTESTEVAQEMAMGALRETPEATWSVAVVGHLGPEAPQEKDGHVFICVARRDCEGNLHKQHLCELVLPLGSRSYRQRCATEVVLTITAAALSQVSPSQEQT